MSTPTSPETAASGSLPPYALIRSDRKTLSLQVTREGRVVDLQGACVLPGLIDIHIHGCAGADFSDGDEAGLRRMTAHCAGRGVTSLLPTTMSLPYEQLKRAFSAGRRVMEDRRRGESRVLGFHMEGPFLSPAKRGAQREDHLKTPDFAAFEALYAASGGAIRIVDGRTTAGGSCLLLRHAAQRIREGAQLQPLAEELRALREQIGIAFSVTDMNPLRRSGRLGIVRQSVGTILNIRPILQLVQGGVVACDTARGRRDQIRKLAGCVPKDAQRLIVHAIGNQHGADDLAAQLEQLFPGVPLERRRVGPVLGIHLGLDVIGVVWDRSPQAASLSF